MESKENHPLHGGVKIIFKPRSKLWVCMEDNGKLRMFSSGTYKNRALGLNMETGEPDYFKTFKHHKDGAMRR